MVSHIPTTNYVKKFFVYELKDPISQLFFAKTSKYQSKAVSCFPLSSLNRLVQDQRSFLFRPYLCK